MAEPEYDELVHDLVTLGRAAAVPTPTGGLEAAVMQRVTAPSPPRAAAEWWPQHRRRVALIVGAVLFALLATPPVRAAVADWFGFGAVRVEHDGSAPTGPASPPPTVAPGRSVSEAAAQAGFAVSLPEELGEPDGVHVADDGATVSMSWTTVEGPLRLDQYDARLDFAAVKRTPSVLFTDVGGTDGVWFEEPHEVALLDDDGTPTTHSARLAGHTLIWQAGDVTLRLEGDVSLERAVEIAESAVPVG